MTSALSHVADLRPTAAIVRPSWQARTFGVVWRWAVGTLLCLTPVTAVIALGWLTRFTGRAALRRWYVLAGGSTAGSGFGDFVQLAPDTARFARWPNWVTHELGARVPIGEERRRPVLVIALGALWDNLRTGIAAIANVWLVTLPPACLWALGWSWGWENSFNKGYEQSWVGPLVFAAGAVLFALVMVYLPLAQARQAVTGEWRSFYDVRVIRALARRRWHACLGLALLFALAALPVMGLAVLPIRLDLFTGPFDGLSEAELRRIGRVLALGTAGFLFATLLVLRCAMAQVYAGAMVDAVRDGSVTRDQLGTRERAAFERLHLFHPDPRQPGRAAAWLGSAAARAAGLALTFAVWGAFAFELVAVQFLNHVWIAWLNHPLIQLPWRWTGPV